MLPSNYSLSPNVSHNLNVRVFEKLTETEVKGSHDRALVSDTFIGCKNVGYASSLLEKYLFSRVGWSRLDK